MPERLGEATQMIGPFVPVLVCWSCLIITVVGLGVTFFWTNITAFARRIRDGQREPAAGTVIERRNSDNALP